MNSKDITPRNEKGEAHGSWERYHFNGQLMCKGNFVNDKEHGYWEWYRNGQLWSKGNYVNGKRHGYWVEYDDNSKLINKTYYI